MHNAGEAVAVLHVGGRGDITSHHAGPVHARECLAGACSIDQSIHAAGAACGACRSSMAQQSECTFMLLESDAVVGTRAELYLEVRHHQGLKALVWSARVRDEESADATHASEVFLRFPLVSIAPPPV